MNHPGRHGGGHGAVRTLAALALTCMCGQIVHAEPPAPNVLFIAIDDLRDWVGYLGDNQAKTPNLDRLAARGLSFTRSYCAAPVCNASRVALMSGLRPWSSGVYENGVDWRTTKAAKVPHLNQVFMAAGYDVRAAGKIYHGIFPGGGEYWHAFERYGQMPDLPPEARPAVRMRPGAWGYGNFRIGALDGGDEELPDYHVVEYCRVCLAQQQNKPFFLACGLHKPHLPWIVPQKYFDLYPLDSIALPPVKPDELEGVPPPGVVLALAHDDHKTITEAGKWKEAIRAYLATITYCDAMLGRLIESFDAAPQRENTVIVIWSDHGWHLGEKNHWRKFALWEQATRSPLIIIAPGVTTPGSVCHRPVDFMSIYPTLCDLCELEIPEHVEGTSLKPLLSDPSAPWLTPAVSTYLQHNHAVRSERWRYIRYANGDEELYDHDADPNEWDNLAGEPEHEPVKKALAAFMPNVEETVPSSNGLPRGP